MSNNNLKQKSILFLLIVLFANPLSGVSLMPEGQITNVRNVVEEENSIQELRGTWIARNSLSTKEALASAIDSLAANNFNTIYINVWSRGYPLWQSDVFFNETGFRIDPVYANRDILQEAIVEAHKHGMHVEAWFEYGFVGGWTGNQPVGKKGPIFETYPDWVAKKLDGTEKDNSNFYWMVHTRPDVQDFLIALAKEIVTKYDVDGIELDRIRYSSTEYGYDAYTDSLYRSENNNQPPPANGANPAWIRWRADKLNDFMGRIRDSIKVNAPKVNVSNAPSLYSSNSYTAYNSFCQDWAAWINNDLLDNIQVQSYVSSNTSFGAILDYIKTLVNDHQRVYPAFAVAPNNSPLAWSVIENFVNTTRSKGFKGNSIWFYTDLISYFPQFKATVYSEKAHPPHSPIDWRKYYDIATIKDTIPVGGAINAKLSLIGDWTPSSIVGFSGASLMTNDVNGKAVYTFDVPVDGFYEVYVFNVTASNRNDSALYTVYKNNGDSAVFYLNQVNTNIKRWNKLTDVYLSKGESKVIELNSHNLKSGRFNSTDAVFVKLNRWLSPDVTTSIKNDTGNEMQNTEKKFGLSSYPNPFNNSVKVSFFIKDLEPYSLRLFNSIGQEVYSFDNTPSVVGLHTMHLELSRYASGIYFLALNQNQNQEIVKLSYIK